ncbi:cyclopropane-fatty-acyl-phospholipid synthase [Lysobacter helvus]|uniref:Cyclopropane-fatty-acyl-phospholipid synthase n=2 Tax=Lysobacteraceae TaxID=32033 RepID=A0ABM7Q359_9GAMM|nr:MULTISPECIES: class I SAM-dependent methyltransferase [Lysobacter]BCT91626.1 cyclopropane-fatty-acyl-phospholipid synthase [Lysobacter caseinilyticus]BCT94779.1 cyclopropane-fatty-acyl-phospholipid synthase [Lysobacter helvus]
MNTAIEHLEPHHDAPAPGLLGLAERGWLPDAAVRLGIRRLCAQRLRDERAGGPAQQEATLQAHLRMLRSSPVAVHVDAANRQHYELPAAFFRACLGPRMKYSGCLYPRGDETLAEAEEAMLAAYAERAQLEDGQDILELGCGWGSLTLWMAGRYPNARITAVSNSNAQRQQIEAVARERGLANVRVVTSDVNKLLLPAAHYDRCISVEMFEHMRNYATLMARIGDWLRPGGALFVHVFCHRTLLYPFETQGEDDWMGRHFFTGGLMPSADTLAMFQRDLHLEHRWLVDGTHYQRTANHWLARQDAARDEVLAILREAYGDAAPLWAQRWRMFWMACAELFGYDGGREWMVAHYRFRKEELR